MSTKTEILPPLSQQSAWRRTNPRRPSVYRYMRHITPGMWICNWMDDTFRYQCTLGFSASEAIAKASDLGAFDYLAEATA